MFLQSIRQKTEALSNPELVTGSADTTDLIISQKDVPDVSGIVENIGTSIDAMDINIGPEATESLGGVQDDRHHEIEVAQPVPRAEVGFSLGASDTIISIPNDKIGCENTDVSQSTKKVCHSYIL